MNASQFALQSQRLKTGQVLEYLSHVSSQDPEEDCRMLHSVHHGQAQVLLSKLKLSDGHLT